MLKDRDTPKTYQRHQFKDKDVKDRFFKDKDAKDALSETTTPF